MKRSTLILSGILILLAVAAYVVLQGPGEQNRSGSSGEMLATYDSARIDKIVIVHRGNSVTLEKVRGAWMITSPARHPADPASVDSVLARGKRIELKGLVSANPAKQKVYEVDSSGTSVRVYAQGVEQAAFWIGKAGLQFNEAYVRREGSDEVYETEGPLSWFFAKSLSEWRDRAIVRFDKNALTAVGYRYGDTSFTLVRRDTLWMIDGSRASAAIVEGVLTSLSAYLTNDFVDSAVTPSSAPSAVVDVNGKQIAFYRVKGSDRYLVRSSSSSEWYSVEGWRGRELLKRKKEFLVP